MGTSKLLSQIGPALRQAGLAPLAIIDRMLPADIDRTGSGEAVLRARLFTSFCLVVPVLDLPILVSNILDEGIGSPNTLTTLALLALFGFSLALFSLWRRETAAFYLLLTGGFAIYFADVVESGFLQSEGLIWAPLLPFVIAQYQGKRFALLVGAICLAFVWCGWLVLAPGTSGVDLLDVQASLRSPIEFSCAIAAASLLGFLFTHAREELSKEVDRYNAALNMAGDAIQTGYALLRTILETVPHGIVVKDLDGMIIHANRVFAETWHSAEEELAGMAGAALVGGRQEEQALLVQTDRQVIEGDTQLELTLIRPASDGVPRYVHLVKTPLKDSTGAVTGIVEVAIDVTARVAAEQKARILQRMEAIGQVIGGVCHVSNNINQIIVGNLHPLKKLDDERLSAAAHRIEKAVLRETHMNEQLMAYARRRLPGTREPVRVDDAVAGVFERWRAELPPAITARLATNNGAGSCAINAGDFSRALQHLLGNAQEAIPEHGVVEVQVARVVLQRADLPCKPHMRPGAYAEISVRDAGAGMAPAQVRKAFEPFFTTKDPAVHPGLGLSNVFGFAREACGDVMIESEPGRGTTVRMLIPESLHCSHLAQEGSAA